ncbi:hypothetical protein B5M09_002947 [Aphanomyces astaci]|uniref:Nonsense-mediated mRNA decay factor SMG8 n=1 Tax=Aphanomyces astaci TaxID=112090 RepID=A0A3R8DEK8_APHAT|nr:hypothetical protein B5M09_002947 [Aphanomyces astaci]
MFYDESRNMILLLGTHAPPPDSTWSTASSVHEASVRSRRNHMQMQLLLYSSSHVLFVVHDHARVSTSQTQHFRSLSSAKHRLVHLLKQPKSSKASAAFPLAPGRSVPVTSFVFPVDTGRKLSRPQLATFCKAMESRLQVLLKPLRGGTVATVRAKDASNNNKERRLFVMDPSHVVVAVPRKLATADGDLLARMAAVLDSVSVKSPPCPLDLKHMLKPLDDEDTIGMPHAIQFATKWVDHILHDSMNSVAIKELLPVGQWIRQFQALATLVVADNAMLFSAPTAPSSHLTNPPNDDDFVVVHGEVPYDSAMQALDVFGAFAEDQCARVLDSSSK